MMRENRQVYWIWIAVVMLVLLVGVGLHLRDAAALASEPTTLVTTEATAALGAAASIDEASSDDAAAFNEEEASNELEAQIITIYEQASESVVNITNRSYVYYRFMGAVPEEGTGSGFVYDTEGHIVTNYHVIENAQELLVTLADGQVYEAQVVGSDPSNDLAVIQIDAGEDLPEPLMLGDSDGLRVGQFVVAIGNPYGLEQTLTTGVVSALGRVIEGAEDNSFIGEAIQTDAAINPGNSGGPLLDLHGRVIGVNSQIISPSGASSGIGFAVSSNTVQRVAPELIAKGYYAHPWLGADMMPLTTSVVKVLREAGVDVSVSSGLLVLDVTSGGPADDAGVEGGSQWVRIGRYQLQVDGDIITAINGQATPDLETLTVCLETETSVGDTVNLTIQRGDQELAIPVTLEEEPRG